MTEELERSVRRGLAWSMASTLALRFGSLVVGIVLARLLSPEEFGVYAIALTIQSIMMTLVDLGLTADLVRADDAERLAPTVATFGLVLGATFAVTMAVSAGLTAEAFRTPAATPVIFAMSFTLLISGMGVVPCAMLQRAIEQKKLFIANIADFVVGTTVTIALVVLGLGPLSLAIGRLAAQASATTLQFVLSGRRPQFGFDKSEAGPALRFGIPVAAANLLSWALINVDNVVIARVADATALGLYVLAFNIANWPMNAIGQAIRSVSLAAFSHTNRDRVAKGSSEPDRDLAVGTAFSWAAGVPAGVLLAALSVPLIQLLYGEAWLPSAAVLAALGYFGALRILFDMMATYLLARGAARPVLYVQILWMITLIPAVVVGVRYYGIAGAGYAHVVTGVIVVLPAYLVALHRCGTDVRAVIRALIPPALAAAPTWAVANAISNRIGSPIGALLLGGLAGLSLYLLLLAWWLVRLVLSIRSPSGSETGGNRTPDRVTPG